MKQTQRLPRECKIKTNIPECLTKSPEYYRKDLICIIDSSQGNVIFETFEHHFEK